MENIETKKRGRGRPSKFSDAQKQDILARHQNGEKIKAIAEAYNSSYSTVRNVIKRNS